MATKNYIKALRRAKSKKIFNTNLIAFSTAGMVLFLANVSFIAPNMPWCMIPISIMSVVLIIHKLLLFQRPQKTIFARDYLQYQTEKELRLIEFQDDMDELEAEKMNSNSLDLAELATQYRSGESELV